MKPKWHKGKVDLQSHYQVTIRNAFGQEFAPGAICDGYNLATISGAMKSGVALLLNQGESGMVNVYKNGKTHMVHIAVTVLGKDICETESH